jgi:site-specific DNA recombinase
MEDNIGFWMDAIKNALNIDSLTREILSALIDHIVVYEREKVDGETRQRVEIFYKFVGNLSGTSEQKNRTMKPSLAG